MVTLTIVVPTFRRPQDLHRCLSAIATQTRPADEVIVIVRDSDAETWNALATWEFSFPLRTATVKVPGVVAAMNLGLESATGDIIAFTDDDAAPRPDWLSRIETWMQSQNHLGAIGGRDWQYDGDRLIDTREKRHIGQVQWWGRLISDHHLAVGDPQTVDVLKGVNMAFRRSAIGDRRFDPRMRGTGAQVHFELAFILTLKRAGWTIMFDPDVAVDHYPAIRFDEDQRHQFNALAWCNAVHNQTVALLDHFSPVQRGVFLLWSLLIGTRDAFGILQWCRFWSRERTIASQKLFASWHGRWQGWKTWYQTPDKSADKSAPLNGSDPSQCLRSEMQSCK